MNVTADMCCLAKIKLVDLLHVLLPFYRCVWTVQTFTLLLLLQHLLCLLVLLFIIFFFYFFLIYIITFFFFMVLDTTIMYNIVVSVNSIVLSIANMCCFCADITYYIFVSLSVIWLSNMIFSFIMTIVLIAANRTFESARLACVNDVVICTMYVQC